MSAGRTDGQKALIVAIHAEMLQDPGVWQQVYRLSARAARRRLALTVFVHPFWASAAARDIAPLLRELASHGHEIAQHTHYYDAATRSLSDKASSMAEPDVRRRLEEDFDILCAAGYRPQGFVSGAWMVPDQLRPWLRAHGFRYDCTRRTYVEERASVPPAGPSPHPPVSELLELPTTATLRMAVLRLLHPRTPSARVGGIEYILVYLHDQDLLVRWKRSALWVALTGYRWRHYRLMSAGHVADLARQDNRRAET